MGTTTWATTTTTTTTTTSTTTTTTTTPKPTTPEPTTPKPTTPEPTTPEPTTPEKTTKPTTVSVTADPDEEPICDFFSNIRRIDCSNRMFDNDSIQKMLTRLQVTHSYPVMVDGVKRMVKAHAVKELVVEHNPILSDNASFLKVISANEGFPNLRELYIGNTGITLTKDQMKMANPKIKFIKSKPL